MKKKKKKTHGALAKRRFSKKKKIQRANEQDMKQTNKQKRGANATKVSEDEPKGVSNGCGRVNKYTSGLPLSNQGNRAPSWSGHSDNIALRCNTASILASD